LKDIIPYAKHDLTEADKKAVLDAMESSAWTQGPKVHELEKAVAEYVKAKHSVAVTNGTAALHLGVLSLERFYRKNKSFEKKKKVISTPITFAASTNCALYADLIRILLISKNKAPVSILRKLLITSKKVTTPLRVSFLLASEATLLNSKNFMKFAKNMEFGSWRTVVML
jgi:hypothetical protein